MMPTPCASRRPGAIREGHARRRRGRRRADERREGVAVGAADLPPPPQDLPLAVPTPGAIKKKSEQM